MKIKLYSHLTHDVVNIRMKVFMQEQGFKDEFDETDEVATHLLMFTDDGVAVGTCRFFDGDEDGCCILGRVAVLKEFRGQGLGKEIIKAAENAAFEKNYNSIQLHAQERVCEFYERLGYSKYGEMDYDEDCPHRWMKKKLR